MASDVLQDLMRALCALSVVEPPFARRLTAGASLSTVRSAPASERRDASAQEAA